jgi:MFS family permease
MTAESPHRLLLSRRFLPLFLTQALGAMNDNLFKNALGVMALFLSTRYGSELVAIGLGIFILPYVLFSSLAGELADRTDKARLIRLTKLWEVGLMLLGGAGFLTASLPLLMAVLFGLGMQATFFSPLKYGILPDHLPETALVAGNGAIEAGTFLGILAGTIVGSALIRLPHGPDLVAGLGLTLAGLGYLASRSVPPTAAAAPGLGVDFALFPATLALIRSARANRDVWLAILGISWFWAVGAMVLSQVPVAAKDILAGDAGLITLLLTVFSLGVGAGSLGCARLLHGEVSARLVPMTAILITGFTFELSRALADAEVVAGPLAMLSAWGGRRILADLFILAASGGIFSVSLYALLQDRADPSRRSRMIAANNVLNAAAMTVASLAATGFAAAGMSVPSILLATGVANVAVCLAILRVLPLWRF